MRLLQGRLNYVLIGLIALALMSFSISLYQYIQTSSQSQRGTLSAEVKSASESNQSLPSPNTNSVTDNQTNISKSPTDIDEPDKEVPAVEKPSSKYPVDSFGYFTFTGQQFHELYEQTSYQNVTQLSTKPYIFGEVAADRRIQELAEGRGYKLRPEAVNKTLQPEAKEAWEKLSDAAKKDGLNLVLVSGFRSVNDQRSIFINALGGVFTPAQIASGQADNRILEILQTRSIPGYSRHHTGYTIDIGCGSNDLIGFKNTKCFEWISANNYLQAKKVGLIPSYPSGVEKQGPNPEEWEYVWVGESELKP